MCGGAVNTPSTLVVGIGNILLKDEGVGVRAVEAMMSLEWPETVELLDGGTSGADLLDHVANRRKVIVVDAVDADAPPGTVLRFSGEDLARREGERFSLHELGLLEILAMARQLGCAPREVVIIGIQPKEIGPGLELSDEVAAVLPRVLESVRAEIPS